MNWVRLLRVYCAVLALLGIRISHHHLQVSALLGMLLASIRYRHVLRILHITGCFSPKPPTADSLGNTCPSPRAFVVVPRISSIEHMLTLMPVNLEIVEGLSLWTAQSRQSCTHPLIRLVSRYVTAEYRRARPRYPESGGYSVAHEQMR